MYNCRGRRIALANNPIFATSSPPCCPHSKLKHGQMWLVSEGSFLDILFPRQGLRSTTEGEAPMPQNWVRTEVLH